MSYLRAHVVGSMLRPSALLGCLRAFAQGVLDTSELQRVQDRAVDEVIAVQEGAGIDLITDGEQRRLAFGDVFGRSVLGIEPVEPQPAGRSPLWRGGDDGSRQLEISSPTGGIIVERLRRGDSKGAKQFAYARGRARRPVKVTLPSPTMLMASWSQEHSAQAYRSLSEALDDVMGILKEEVHELAQAACSDIQFDAPETTFAIEGGNSFMLRAAGRSRESFCAEVVDQLSQVAVEPGVEFSVHFCRGNARGHWHSAGGYDAISKLVFPYLAKFTYVLLEYDSKRAGSFEPLADLPESCCAVLGLLSTKNGQLERRDDLVARIDQAAKLKLVGDIAHSVLD